MRTAMMMIRPIKATGRGVRLDAERNASGMEIIAPTIVPKKAMQMVSISRYGTPCTVRLNSSPVSG